MEAENTCPKIIHITKINEISEEVKIQSRVNVTQINRIGSDK